MEGARLGLHRSFSRTSYFTVLGLTCITVFFERHNYKLIHLHSIVEASTSDKLKLTENVSSALIRAIR
jgi:hypothetical protein